MTRGYRERNQELGAGGNGSRNDWIGTGLLASALTPRWYTIRPVTLLGLPLNRGVLFFHRREYRVHCVLDFGIR